MAWVNKCAARGRNSQLAGRYRGEHDDTTRESLLCLFWLSVGQAGGGGGEGLCLLTETLADKENFIAIKIFRHTFMFQQDLLGSLSCDSTSIQTIYLFTYDKASHGRAYQHFSLCHFLSVRGC